MANDGTPQLQVYRMRVSRLNAATGAPVAGAQNAYVSSALVTLTPTLVYEDGERTLERNGEGVVCVDFTGPDSLVRVDWTMQLCTPDAYLIEMLTSGTILSADTGAAIGYAIPALGGHNPAPVSIEMWVKRITGGKLDPTYPAARWVMPYNQKIRMDSPGEFSTAALRPTLTGQAVENSQWGNGPFNDWPTGVASDRALFFLPRLASDVPAASYAYTTVPAQT